MVSETLVQVLWTCNTFALSLNPASLAQCFAETINYCMVRCEEKYLAICSLHAKFQAYDVTLIIVTFSREINLQAWERKKKIMRRGCWWRIFLFHLMMQIYFYVNILNVHDFIALKKINFNHITFCCCSTHRHHYLHRRIFLLSFLTSKFNLIRKKSYPLREIALEVYNKIIT